MRAELHEQRERLIRMLEESQREMIEVLRPLADDQDRRPEPDAWSFRYIAAHMATAEEECYQVRFEKMAAGDNPHFDYYWNTDRDFSELDLRDSLARWRETRQKIFDFVRSLTTEELQRTGSHNTFGTFDALGLLEIMYEHDREHLNDLDTPSPRRE